MKKAWPVTKLGDLAELVTKGTTPTSIGHSYIQQGINFVKIESITTSGLFIEDKFAHITPQCDAALARSRLNVGDILFSIAGALGRTALVTEDILPANTNQALAIIRLKNNPKVLTQFVLKALETGVVLDQIEKFRGGVAQQNLSLAQVRDFQIAIPPLAEQQQIIAILDEAFEGIATAKANAETNLRNARGIFESQLQSVFTQGPKSWPTVTIGQVAEVYDGPHATPKTVDSGPIFLGISALQDGKVNLGETRHVTPKDFKQWTRRVKPETDDVVFSYETRLGQAAIIPSGLSCCLGRRMALVRANRDKMNPHFFVYLYISPPFREFLNSRTVRGATVDRISLKEFPSFPINLPPLDEQERLAASLEALNDHTQLLTNIYERKLAALDVLKRSLLHSAFAGELTANKTSELVEAVA